MTLPVSTDGRYHEVLVKTALSLVLYKNRPLAFNWLMNIYYLPRRLTAREARRGKLEQNHLRNLSKTSETTAKQKLPSTTR